jgi:enoyl-CoA hydratase/carnithine racemase
MGNLVTYQLSDAIATITMDDGKVNALTMPMFDGLNSALDRAEADGAVVVLAGREGVFSAGFDLNVLRAGGPDAPALVRTGFELSARLLAFAAPVVVAWAVILAEVYAPDEAVAAGFLDRAVPAEGFSPAARAVAEQLGNLDRAAHAATKQRTRRQATDALRQAIEDDTLALAQDLARA